MGKSKRKRVTIVSAGGGEAVGQNGGSAGGSTRRWKSAD